MTDISKDIINKVIQEQISSVAKIELKNLMKQRKKEIKAQIKKVVKDIDLSILIKEYLERDIEENGIINYLSYRQQKDFDKMITEGIMKHVRGKK